MDPNCSRESVGPDSPCRGADAPGAGPVARGAQSSSTSPRRIAVPSSSIRAKDRRRSGSCVIDCLLQLPEICNQCSGSSYKGLTGTGLGRAHRSRGGSARQGSPTTPHYRHPLAGADLLAGRDFGYGPGFDGGSPGAYATSTAGRWIQKQCPGRGSYAHPSAVLSEQPGGCRRPACCSLPPLPGPPPCGTSGWARTSRTPPGGSARARTGPSTPWCTTATAARPAWPPSTRTPAGTAGTWRWGRGAVRPRGHRRFRAGGRYL